MKSPIVILGASGIIGRGAVQAALEAEWPVIAVDADAAGLERLRAIEGAAGLTLLIGSVNSDAESAALAEAVRKLDRPVAGVIDAIPGGSARGRLLDQPTETLCRQIESGLLPHLAAARQLIPLMAEARRGGTYILIGGPGSALPWSGYGHQSVTAAGLRMLAQVLHRESCAFDVRVQLLSVDLPVCTRKRASDCPQWPTARSIGERALALIERSVEEAGPIVVHGDTASSAMCDSHQSTLSVAAEQLVAKTLKRLRSDADGAKHDPDIGVSSQSQSCLQRDDRPQTSPTELPFPFRNEVAPR
jgi:NAD(P)-dependent dehydrogenase (short-subunit alcohol dehydrogenase family)